MNYSLRLYDEELLRFSLEQRGIEGLVAEIVSVNEEKRSLFPLDLNVSGEGMIAWLQRRVIPRNRAYVDEILASLGLSLNDTKGIIDICKGLSLNDSYWVVPADGTESFAEYNLYENKFSDILALVAYTGTGNAQNAFRSSPELTTGGMLRKAWRWMEDGIYLYKGGTEGFANTGNEPYSEYYASQIAQEMELNAITYDLTYWKDILTSTCKLFTDIDTSYIAVGHIITHGGLKAVKEYYEQLGTEFLEQMASMLVFDAVIYNEDRHFGNFGVLRDNHTGRILAPAPLFDNGNSLFHFAMKDDLQDIATYAKSRSSAYNVPFETICEEFLGEQQRVQLQRLEGFRFTRHPSINMDEERLSVIEAFLQERVRQLLAL